MKVVINRCFGGFCLSDKAVEMIMKRKGLDCFRYAVSKCETLQPTEVDAVQNSGYDLVLYTCTLGGRTRVTVFCDRVE